jgi:hypothetical protein
MISPVDRAKLYLQKVDPAISGHDGHDHTFHVVATITQGFDLSREEALDALEVWNQSCQPPWSTTELTHKIEDALAAPCNKDWGYLLKKTLSPEITFKPIEKKSYASFCPLSWRDKSIALKGSDILASLKPQKLEILEKLSPLPIPKTPEDCFNAFLDAWGDCLDLLWCGHVQDSGHSGARSAFANIKTWKMRGLPGGNKMWTSVSSFILPTSRCQANTADWRWAIVEADFNPPNLELQVAIALWLISIGAPVKMVVFSGSKSLHIWLDRKKMTASYCERLRTLLCGIPDGRMPHPSIDGKMIPKRLGGMGCDDSTFRGSQPCRLPGATRLNPDGSQGNLQRILYLA